MGKGGKEGSYGGPEDGPENVRRPWRVDVLEAQQSVSGRKHGSCVIVRGRERDVDQVRPSSGFSNKVGPVRAISGAWWGWKQIAVG